MRLAVTVVSPATRQSTDIVLDADPATSMAAVTAELGRFARGDGVAGSASSPPAASLYVDCQRIWQRLTLAEAPIRDGCVISLGSPDGCVVREPSGLVDVLVAGGPDAGAIHRIGPGRADIGSGAAAAIRIGDPAVPSRALLVCVDEQGGCQVAAYPEAAATLDRTQLAAPVPWRPGQQIAIGGTLLGLAPYAASDAALRPSPDGAGLDFSRRRGRCRRLRLCRRRRPRRRRRRRRRRRLAGRAGRGGRGRSAVAAGAGGGPAAGDRADAGVPAAPRVPAGGGRAEPGAADRRRTERWRRRPETEGRAAGR